MEYFYSLGPRTQKKDVIPELDGRRACLTIAYEICTADKYSIFHTLYAAIPLKEASGNVASSSFLRDAYKYMTKTAKGGESATAPIASCSIQVDFGLSGGGISMGDIDYKV